MRPGRPSFPDWLLALLEDDGAEPSHALITAASLLYVRRQRPGIGFEAAQLLLAASAADPARLEDLSGRIAAFRLSCCFERLKRAGRFEEVRIDDPFDPDEVVSVTLTEADWQMVNSEASPRDPSRRPHDFSVN